MKKNLVSTLLLAFAPLTAAAGQVALGKAAPATTVQVVGVNLSVAGALSSVETVGLGVMSAPSALPDQALPASALAMNASAAPAPAAEQAPAAHPGMSEAEAMSYIQMSRRDSPVSGGMSEAEFMSYVIMRDRKVPLMARISQAVSRTVKSWWGSSSNGRMSEAEAMSYINRR